MAPAIPFILAASAIGGAIVSAQAAGEQGAAAEAAANANAAQAAENARIIRRESRKRATQAVKGGEELKGTQKAAFGKSGVLLTGSAQDILAETDRITREDVEAILTAGEQGSAEQLFRAGQFSLEAQAAARQKSLAPLATLISGVGSGARAFA